MDDEELKNKMDGTQGTESPVKKSKRDEYMEYLSSRYPGKFIPDNEDESYGFLLDMQKGNDDAQEKMAAALTKDPRLAQLLSDLIEGKRGAAEAFVRYYGKDFLTAEEGTPEYEEIARAEAERMQDLEKERASQAEYEKNVEESRTVLESFAAEKKLNINEFLEEAYDKIIAPIFDGKYSTEVLAMLYKALNYDKDVQDAFDAGTIKTRNEKIEKMKKDEGDGLPRLGGSAGSVKPEKKEAPKIFGRARTSSVWDK